MARRQVNILLSQDERDLVEAVAFVEETTASELLRPVVAAYLTKQRNEPDVVSALAGPPERRARKDGTIANLLGVALLTSEAAELEGERGSGPCSSVKALRSAARRRR